MADLRDIYETYAPDVFRFALSLSGNRHDAEDIVSETFIRAWTNRNGIRTETLKAYLMTIARNAFLDGRRRLRREVAIEESHVDPEPGPDARAESIRELERADAVLRTLPETDRAAFVLRVRHGLPYEEIARVLGIGLSAAKVKVHRARKKMLAACAGEEVT